MIVWTNEWTRSMFVHSLWMAVWLTECPVHLLCWVWWYLTASRELRLLSKLSPWDPSIVTHSLPPALKSSASSSPFYYLWNPAEGKSVKLEVGVDKSTKGSNSPPSEMAIGLSPYAFPREWSFHVPGEENIAQAGVCLAGLCTPISSGATEIRALQ